MTIKIQKIMFKKNYCLHVALIYLDGNMCITTDRVIEFEGRRKRPKITVEELKRINKTLQEALGCKTITIQYWQWFDNWNKMSNNKKFKNYGKKRIP